MSEVNKTNKKVQFTLISNAPLTIEDAQNFQTAHGYIPAGYGLYDFKCESVDDKYHVSWNCNTSCD